MIQLPQHSNVKLHEECFAELDDLIRKDERPAFIAAYKLRIGYLSQNIGRETNHRAWFEVLRNAKGLRSIRFMNIQNIRILYMLEERKAFLLLAFVERKGHKNTEYSQYFDVALRRLKEREKMK